MHYQQAKLPAVLERPAAVSVTARSVSTGLEISQMPVRRLVGARGGGG